MSALKTYSYVVLRYVHDISTGEFVNVGVALYCKEARYVSAMCRTTYSRIKGMFPGMNTEHFRSLMRFIQARFEEEGERMARELPLNELDSIEQIAKTILPTDDSSLQWSRSSAGRTTDPAAVLERLFNNLVMKYEERTVRERKTEDDVWRNFKRDLEVRQVLHHLEPKTISVRDDEIDFNYTWQNGALHCLEPVSFDLATPDGIKDKAHRWLGKVASIASSTPLKFHIYFLVGKPQDEGLQKAFSSALSILQKMPVNTLVFDETQSDELALRLQKAVEEHEAHQR